MPLMSPFPQNPKFQEPVTLDFLDAELENDIKVEVRRRGEVLLTAPHAFVSWCYVIQEMKILSATICSCEISCI